MIRKFLIGAAAALASIFALVPPAVAAEFPLVGSNKDQGIAIYTVVIPTTAGVNDISKPIPSCNNMTVYWERGNSAVVSLYPADSDDDTSGEITANTLIKQFTTNERYGTFTPTKQFVRFVVNTVNASVPSSAKVFCSNFASSTGSGGVQVVSQSALATPGQSQYIYQVTDATTASDCATGTPGSVVAYCGWNGSAYVSLTAGVSGITAVLDDTTPKLGGNLDPNGKDINSAKAIGKVKYAEAFASGSSSGGIQEAIDSCGQGSTALDADQGCRIVMPKGTVDVSTTIVIGGAPIADNMQNGIVLMGHGGGIQTNPGNDELAGTTLRWTGSNGGTILEVHGMNHHIMDFMIDGNDEAGYGIVQIGNNSNGDATGKNIYENITINDVLDTTNASTGWAFAIGTSNLGQNDHTILNQIRSINNRHCLLAMDTQGVMNTANTFECTAFAASPGIQITQGSIKFNDLYIGGTIANAVGMQVDACATSVEVDTGAVEWTGDNGTIFRFSNRNADGCNSTGTGYASAIRNVRFLLQTTASTEHTCVQKDTTGDLILEGNMWTSDLHARTCDFEFDNIATAQDSHVAWINNRVGWEYGFYRDAPSVTVAASGGQNTKVVFVDGNGVKLKDKNGTASIVKDATGLFADNNANGSYDAGTDLRFDPSTIGDISAIGGCPTGACWTASTSGLSDANGLFSQNAFSIYLDDDESTSGSVNFSINEVVGGSFSPRFRVNEGGAVTTYAEILADALGIEFESGSSLANCTTFASGGGIYYDSANSKLKKCQGGTLTDLDTGGGGIATDTFWAAAGDLAVGSGNDTASVLSKGTDGQVLRMASGSVGWGDFDIDFASLDASNDDFLDVAAGGTGVGSFTSNAILKGNGTGDLVASGVTIDGSNNLSGMAAGTFSGAVTATSFVPADFAAEPGNLIQLLDNATAFTNDPNCTNSGVAKTLTIIDKNESSSVEDWVVCNGTTELGNFANFADLDVAETITGNWVNTANPWADNEVADTITASNYLPLAGGTVTGNAVITSGATLRPTGTGIVEATEVDASAGAAPTANGAVLYDSTANDLEYGDNGTNRKVANLDEAQTLSSKTLASPVLTGTVSGNDTIPNTVISTIRQTLPFHVVDMEVDGTNCVKNAAAVVNSGPKIQTITCADNDTSTLYGSVKMPDGWNGSSISFTLAGYSVNAADTGELQGDFTAFCRTSGSLIDNTWATEVTTDVSLGSGQFGQEFISSATITPNGGCTANGSAKTLFWRYQVDAGGTTAVMTDFRFTDAAIEYVSNVGD